MIRHGFPPLNAALPARVTPCAPPRNHTALAPDAGSCHTTSGWPSPLKSPIDTIRQVLLFVKFVALVTTLPSAPPKYHTCTAPLTGSCHTTSGRPSPLKSPVPTIFHGLLAVRFTAFNSAVPCAPPISQICASPVTGSCQIRSGWPSPLKSATDMMRQALAPFNVTAPVTTLPCVPPRNQTWAAPLTGSCHTTSGRPSPSKSPTPTMCHGLLAVRLAAPMMLVPCAPPNNHTCARPETGSCQMMSVVPSRLKSDGTVAPNGSMVVRSLTLA